MIDSTAVVGKPAVIAAKGHCLRKFHLMVKSFSLFFKKTKKMIVGSARACEIQAEGNFGRELAWADSSFSINRMLCAKKRTSNIKSKHLCHFFTLCSYVYSYITPLNLNL